MQPFRHTVSMLTSDKNYHKVIYGPRETKFLSLSRLGACLFLCLSQLATSHKITESLIVQKVVDKFLEIL